MKEEQNENTFVMHTGCDECGSKDNNALYSDGSTWCFGCQKYKPGPKKNKQRPAGRRSYAPGCTAYQRSDLP